MPPLKELHYFDLPGTRVKKAERIYRGASRNLARYNAKRATILRRPLERRDLVFLRDFIALPKRIDVERYAHLFDRKRGAIAGDVTPGYSGLEPRVIAMIAARFPALKVVYIARNPVDRFWSAFNMRLRRGDIPARTDVAAARAFARRAGVKRRSSPSTAVSRWRNALSKGQFGLFFFDDLLEDPLELRHRILSFLGGSPELGGSVDVAFNRKEAQTKVDMSDEMRAAVGVIFATELKACADQLGGPARGWAAAYGLDEVVGAFLGCEGVEEKADTSPEAVDGALCCLAQEGLELGEGVLDGVEVGTVGRQQEKLCPGRFDGLAHRGGLVGSEVVHDDDVFGQERGDEDLFDIGEEGRPIHRPVKDHRRRHAGEPQAGDEGRGLPVTVRDGGPAAVDLRRPPAQAGHVGGCTVRRRRQPLWIEIELPVEPGLATSHDVGTILLGGMRRLLNVMPRRSKKRQIVPRPTPSALQPQLDSELGQRHVGSCRDQAQNERGFRLDPPGPAITAQLLRRARAAAASTATSGSRSMH